MKQQPTSIKAYKGILKSLPKSRGEVLKKLIILKSSTNLELARALNWDINRITPRIHELRQDGLVVEEKREKSPITGKKSIYWKPVKVAKKTFFERLLDQLSFLKQ